MNNSTSKPSAHWPTTWPPGSFRAGPTALLVAALLIACVAIVGVGFAVLRSQIQPGGVVPVMGAILLQFVLEAVIVATIVVTLPRISGFSLRELGFKKMRATDVLYGLGGAVAMLIIVQGSSALVDALAHTQHQQQVVRDFEQLRTPAKVVFFAFFAAVVAPIAEETIFRIFLFNAVMRYGGFWTGALVSGLCFGAVHGDRFAFVPLALGGVLLCYVYYRSGNAFASMISHGLFNAATLVALLFTPQLTH